MQQEPPRYLDSDSMIHLRNNKQYNSINFNNDPYGIYGVESTGDQLFVVLEARLKIMDILEDKKYLHFGYGYRLRSKTKGLRRTLLERQKLYDKKKLHRYVKVPIEFICYDDLPFNDDTGTELFPLWYVYEADAEPLEILDGIITDNEIVQDIISKYAVQKGYGCLSKTPTWLDFYNNIRRNITSYQSVIGGKKSKKAKKGKKAKKAKKSKKRS